MAFVRYQSPDDSVFMVFDESRFRLDHGLFLLRVEPLRVQIERRLEEQRDWNLQAMKLVEENRRLSACLEWLGSLAENQDMVAIPDLKHEPAIDVVADQLIGDREYHRAFCPACGLEYEPGEIVIEPWQFEEEGVTLRGRHSSCQQRHILHVLTDEVEALDLESPDD